MKAVHVIALVLFAAAATAHAQAGSPPAAAASAALADGEVRKVDKEAGKVTLKHGRIESLDMPPMTMVFRTADPKFLDQLKEGDRIRFSAARVNGAITITGVEAAK